jgi:hypothetical protein
MQRLGWGSTGTYDELAVEDRKFAAAEIISVRQLKMTASRF